MRKRKNFILLLLFLIPAIFISGKFIYSKKTTGQDVNYESQNKNDDKAPELNNKTGKWINTEKEITLENSKGKVLLIEFWTFGCYNCLNTLPHLKEWYEKYKSDSFEMIGVHCPEFDNERNFDNVRSKAQELGIKYPVLTDNEFSIWNNYGVNAWPTIILIDKKGEIRYKKIGEGQYDKTEKIIYELLKESYTPEENN